jgi:hypothetical protein
MTMQLSPQLSPNRLAAPPPLELDLIDADRVTGWITGDRVGFLGFANEVEAAHAAWVAYRTLVRRLARTHNIRPIPIDTEPLAVRRRGDREQILASGHPIAALVRPGPGSPSGPDSFGFEIRIPHPVDEIRVRAMAYLMYITLHKSGIRWALWRPARKRAERPPVVQPPIDGRRNESTNESTTTANGGESDGIDRLRQRARRLLAPRQRRARRPSGGAGQGRRVRGLRER